MGIGNSERQGNGLKGKCIAVVMALAIVLGIAFARNHIHIRQDVEQQERQAEQGTWQGQQAEQGTWQGQQTEQEQQGKQETLELGEASAIEEGIASDRAEELAESVKSTVVGVSTASTSGSGVIYTVSDDSLCVVTAAHILPKGEASREVQVRFSDGVTADCSKISVPEDADIAFLTVSVEQMGDGWTERYGFAPTDKESYDELGLWDTVFCAGLPDGEWKVYEGFLTEAWIYVEDFAQYMMVAKCQVYPGMSGGGLYDERGNLIGIVCGGNGQGELVAVPLHVAQAKYMERY